MLDETNCGRVKQIDFIKGSVAAHYENTLSQYNGTFDGC